jgi:hypothetical protein
MWCGQVDPEGKRTIGVLTMPDLVGPGAEAEVMKVLTNQKKALKLGYVMHLTTVPFIQACTSTRALTCEIDIGWQVYHG